jgi:hypothetical protein
MVQCGISSNSTTLTVEKSLVCSFVLVFLILSIIENVRGFVVPFKQPVSICYHSVLTGTIWEY